MTTFIVDNFERRRAHLAKRFVLMHSKGGLHPHLFVRFAQIEVPILTMKYFILFLIYLPLFSRVKGCVMDADDGQLLPGGNKWDQQGFIFEGEGGNGKTPTMMKVRGKFLQLMLPRPLNDSLHRG